MFSKFVLFVYVSVLSLQLTAQTQWYDPMQESVPPVHGRAWNREIGKSYHRLPERAAGIVRKAVWNLSCQSAGLHLKFYSNANYIQVKYTVKGGIAMPHMPATGVSGVDLYTKDCNGNNFWCAGNYSFGDTILYQFKDLTYRNGHQQGNEFTLNLPLYNEIGSLQIGVPEGSVLTFIPPTQEKPIVVYGTSIAQGACASRPGLAWTNILQRKLDIPVINLGFSGNGQLEKTLFDLLAEIDAQLYVIDCMPNMTGERTTLIKERIIQGVKELRKKSQVPILLVEHDGYMGSFASEVKKESFDKTNKALKSIYEELRQQTENLYYLTYEELGLTMDSQVDGIHATDLGMQQYANAYATKIAAILSFSVIPTSSFIPCRQRREPDTYEWNQRHETILSYNQEVQPEIAVIGNSIIHYWSGEPHAPRQCGNKSWNQLFKNKKVVNMGCGWDRIENVLWRIQHGELDGFQAQKVFLLIGTNNLETDTDENIVLGIKDITETIHSRQPQAEILVIGILPRKNQEKRIEGLNKQIAKKLKPISYIRFADISTRLKQKNGLIQESLFRDGLHPNENGYLKIAHELKQFLSSTKNKFITPQSDKLITTDSLLNRYY